jgi:hypothetical protein
MPFVLKVDLSIGLRAFRLESRPAMVGKREMNPSGVDERVIRY